MLCETMLVVVVLGVIVPDKITLALAINVTHYSVIYYNKFSDLGRGGLTASMFKTSLSSNKPPYQINEIILYTLVNFSGVTEKRLGP